MQFLELKVPPMIVALAMGAIMWLMDWWFPLQNSRSFGRTMVALVIFGVAVAITTIAVLGFRKARKPIPTARHPNYNAFDFCFHLSKVPNHRAVVALAVYATR